MCSEVHLQTGLPFELLLTDLTLMHSCFILLPHLLSQVDTFVMDGQVIMAPETLPTLLTLVGFLPRVYFLVFGQMVVAYERLSAFVTLVALVVVVDSKMKPIRAAVAETLSTDTAEVRFLSAVNPQMFSQRCPLPH